MSRKAFLLRRCSGWPGTDCWEWSGYIHPTGYGGTSIDGSFILAHRLSYETFVQPIPKNFCVLHRCDNRRCINPDHLFLGSRADNNADRDKKGRAAIGDRIFTTKLSPKGVLQIRQLFSTGDHTKKDLADRFGVSANNIKEIVTNRIWKHL